MKNTQMPILILGIIGLLVLAGCVNPTTPPVNDQNDDEVPVPTSHEWVYYAPVQAKTNPWQVSNVPSWSIKTEMEQVSGWMNANGISSTQFGFIPHDDIVCKALNCPRGDYLLIKPSTDASHDKLIQLGFAHYTEVGVIASEMDNALSITIVNAGNETIYYGGCNDFTLEKITATETIPIVPKVCVWEGIPTALAAGDDVTFDYAPTQSGKYRVVFGYGTACIDGQPLSEANCASMHILYSNAITVNVSGGSDYVNMIYDLTQCNTNPWQGGIDSNDMSAEDDKESFQAWVEDNGLHPISVSFVPAEINFISCTACSCPAGSQYQIVIPSAEQSAAEELEFSYNGVHFPTLSAPDYAAAQWLVYTPFQCFANQWNIKKESVHSVEKDLQLMKVWLGDKGVTVDYLAFIRGVSLSAQCTKLSTDKYAVGILNESDAEILHELGFVNAGKSQVTLFTDTTTVKPISLLYKTKFCAGNPWGEPVLDMSNYADVSVAVTQWLTEQGVQPYSTPSIHTVPISFSGTCDTDSGLGVYISVPAWTETHLSALGFGKPSTLFTLNAEKSQVYPAVETAQSVDVNAGVTA